MARNSMQLILLVAAFAGVSHALSSLGGTSYDNNFDKQCGNDQALYKLYSNHNNHKEDRTWTFYCSGNYNLNDNNPGWTGYINGWDGNLNYKCGANKALVGVSSYHSNHKEDRRWRFKCKSFNQVETYGCAHTGYINSWDGNMNWQLSNTNQVINGLYSNHNNHKEDRVWKVWKCNLCSVSITWHNWGSWGSCPRACTPVGSAASTQRRSRTARNNRPQPFCSKIDHATKYQTQECNEKVPCPVAIAGRWSCWSAWSACSKACGVGHRTRTRSCTNPSRANGGATCSGVNSQTKSCNTAKFEPTPSSIISGHDDKTFSNLKSHECLRKCASETSFSCLSYEYNPTTKACRISRVKKGSPGTSFLTGGAYKAFTYYEKSCKTNSALPLKRRTVNVWGDNCHKTNCYSKCGESQYINMVKTGNTITLIYVRFDLSTLPTVLSGTHPKKVIVHAQTVYLTKRLDISYDLEVVTRQAELTGSSIYYDKNSYTQNLPVNRCYKSSVHIDCSINIPMTLMSYYGNGRIDIYAEGIKGGPSCSNGRIVTNTPKFDVTALKAALACAEDLQSTAANGQDTVAYNILSYIKHAGRDPAGFSNANEGRALVGTADSVIGRMDYRKANKHVVPVISQALYTEMLGRYESIFDVYHRRFNNIFNKNLDMKNRLTDLREAVAKANGALTLQEKKLEIAAGSVKESELTLEKLRDEFLNSQLVLEEAQTTFEKGMADYKKQAEIKAGFGFVQMAGAITSAAAGVASAKGGDMKDLEQLYDMMEATTDLITTIVELAEMIQDVVELTKTMAAVTVTANGVKEVVDNLALPKDPDASMAACEAAADARVKIVVWDNLKNVGNTQLTGDPMDGIGGSQDYHKALADIANWGKALTQQTLDHADLVTAYIEEALAKEVAKQQVDVMTNLLNQANHDKAISDQMLREVSSEVVSKQLSAMRTSIEFCMSFYFYNLDDCPSNCRMHLSSSLVGIRDSLNNAKKSTVESAGSKSVTPYKGHHVLTDKVTSHCTDPEKCPITTLKKRKQLLIRIPLTSSNLQHLGRVRFEEARIFIAGAKFKSSHHKIKLFFDSLGEMQDTYNGHTYNFVTVGRKLTFSFNYQTHQIDDYACVHKSAARNYYQLTPFGQFTLSIHDTNNNVDLSGITRVEIYFIGMAVKTSNYRPAVPGNQFERWGQADRSAACGGSGGITKRSFLSRVMNKKM